MAENLGTGQWTETPSIAIANGTIIKGWPKKQIELLKQLWSENRTCSYISNHIGEPFRSRNAVIGKIHRLGLPRPIPDYSKNARPNATPKKIKAKKAEVTKPSKPQTPALHWTKHNRLRLPLVEEGIPNLSLNEIDAHIPIGQRKNLMGLTDTTCKWPVGDPATPDFFFCGATTDTHVYCPYHWSVATR